ncbi:glycosyltransferase family 1 protein [Flavobacterium silvisoli]|uniref:Glycosyltransferase family 1 protein n=1 Tax=Flavobacterium silvisoli TaxID=2529433 RepID=A0A4Q9Z4M2_9FLAO|nr:glycosyltransferase family 4 protein [Flavobacterium silvisoli]TBX71232.1 glycosyltransferase family 1 protein [Flavobacterium silvisoli]
MKSNILFLHQSAELYGSDKTILMFISNLDKSKYEPIVILPFEGPLKDELEKNNIKVIISPVLKLYRKMMTPKGLVKFFKEYRQGLKQLEELHKQYDFKLVYSHTLAVLIGILFAQKKKIKHLWHVQEILAKPIIINKLFKWILAWNSNHKVIYDSEETMNFWIEGNQKLAAKSDFIWNGLDVSQKPQYSEQDINAVRKEFLQVSKEQIVIGLVGRINSWKGQQLLLKAFHLIADKFPQTQLVFIGSAPPNQEFFELDLKAKISEFQLNQRVTIIPFREDIWKFWEAIDIAVVPSTEPEPFGMVAIEAMLAKKPVIAANHGGLTEIVLPEETGLLFEPRNSEKLAEALTILISDADKRTSFGLKGRERVHLHFSLEKHVSQFEAVFESLIGS